MSNYVSENDRNVDFSLSFYVHIPTRDTFLRFLFLMGNAFSKLAYSTLNLLRYLQLQLEHSIS